MHLNDKRCPDVVFICISEKYGSTAIYEPFHTYFKVWIILIVEDPTSDWEM